MSEQAKFPERIETTRLVLRRPQSTDVASMVALANNPKMPLTTATLPFPFTTTDGEAVVASAVDRDVMDMFAIALADDSFIGCILFKYSDGKAPEIGYWLGEPFWGQGFAGEAVAAMIAAVRDLEGFETIDARVLADNPASTRVLEKAGFAIVEHTQSVVERHRGKPLLILRWSAR